MVFIGFQDVVTYVAPFTGAWVEILFIDVETHEDTLSHPSRVRGLKFETGVGSDYIAEVAPFTGAWVEIRYPLMPCVGKRRRTLHGCVG